MPSVSTYTVYRITGPFRPGVAVPYDFVEVLTCTSQEAAARDFARPNMAPLMAEFAEKTEFVFVVADMQVEN